MKPFAFFVLLLFLSFSALAQSHKQLHTVALNDSIPTINLKEINVISHKQGLFGFWERWRLRRLIYNVKKVYPYAKTAGALLKEYNVQLENAKTEAQKKKLMKQAENELKAKYGKQLMQLNFTQGIILIKLIDRETGNTSYDLVAGLRGKFIAFFYQGIARIWGYNLKVHYDPKGKDKDIETIVKLINEGKL
ncbi:MAG: DUF4294 domain-containing protein [Bacteroidales bacterium]|nr:DUF4294 domain-containing protein [Bacteroidales bacterium]